MKNRRLEWALAIALIVIMFAAAVGQAAAVVEDCVQDHRQIQKSLHVPVSESMKTDYVWGTINAYDVNLREGPGLWFEIVGSISRGAAVEVMREADGWYEILHWSCAEPVWVYGEYVSFGR